MTAIGHGAPDGVSGSASGPHAPANERARGDPDGHDQGHLRAHPHAHDHGQSDDHGHTAKSDLGHGYDRGHDHDHGHGRDHKNAPNHHGHHDGHGHGHGHGHSHAHGFDASKANAFLIAVVLNTAFVAVEFFYGVLANSTALMADAGHNLSDVLGLLLSWGAVRLARKAPSQRFTFGLRGASILAALGNAMLLLLACGAIAWEAIHRFFEPPSVVGLSVMVVALVGVAVNGFSAWLFVRGSQDDLNLRGAYLHMAADAAISLGVAASGLVILYTGWSWLDPVVSLLIVLVIVLGTWTLLRESVQLAMNAVPDQVNVQGVAEFLRCAAGVSEVCDLHIWALSTTENALTAELVMPNGHPGDAAMHSIRETLKNQFSIHHSTLQIALAAGPSTCALAHELKAT